MDATTLYNEVKATPLDAADRAFLRRAANAIADLYNTCTPDNADEANYLKAGMRALGELTATPGATPELFFEMEAFGGFKECYYLSPHFVLKFCSRRNPTIPERELLERAIEAGLSDVFLPTRYVCLSRLIPSASLDKDDDDREVYDEEYEKWIENPTWVDNSDFDYLCIQLRAIPLGDSDDNSITFSVQTDIGWERSRKMSGLPADAIKEDWIGLQGVAIPWLWEYIHRYGVEAARKLNEFCTEYHVWDLHAENVGVSADDSRRPIILDWMSR